MKSGHLIRAIRVIRGKIKSGHLIRAIRVIRGKKMHKSKHLKCGIFGLLV